jgi:hypothetical protein
MRVTQNDKRLLKYMTKSLYFLEGIESEKRAIDKRVREMISNTFEMRAIRQSTF